MTMSNRDPRIDAYIEKSADFAKPILRHLRKVVHTAVPDVREGWKWSFPHFDYKGIFCGMAAFKEHCTFGFWKHQLLVERGLVKDDDSAMGQMGKIKSIGDLPSEKQLIKIIRAAAELNDQGIKIERSKKPRKPPVKVPAYFTKALRQNKKAASTFQAFSPSNKREYVEWVTEAKADDTRQRRLETAVAWMAEGKTRNWKYERST